MTGYVLKMFPRFSETFILQEILELERRGAKLAIFSLKRPDDGIFHRDVSRVRSPVRYLPERFGEARWRVLLRHAAWLRRRPLAYLSVLLDALTHPSSWKGFWRAPLVASAARAAGCRRLHAHFASLPAVTAMFAAALAGVPFSVTAHAKDIYIEGRSRRLLRSILRRAAVVVTVSDHNVAHLRRLLGEDGGARIARVYNSVDVGAITPRAGGRQDVPLVFAVGRLVEKKGFADLLDACAILRDRGVRFRCRIAGKGPERARLERIIAERRLTGIVELLGAQPRERVIELLHRAHLLAAPCIVARDGNRDGLPTVILEAMAAGLPVVATPVTGIPEAVDDHRTGRLVPARSPERLARAIERLLSDDLLRVRMGRAARARAVERFDLRTNTARLAALVGIETPGGGPAEQAPAPVSSEGGR